MQYVTSGQSHHYSELVNVLDKIHCITPQAPLKNATALSGNY